MADRSEQIVTVFGGSGFIGRYVCEVLLKSGVRVRVASRDPRRSYFIQPLGQVGQFGFVQADITEAASVRRANEKKMSTHLVRWCARRRSLRSSGR